MEQTITINVPEGKIAKYNEKTQTIEFVDKEPIRSKSWDEFCENHPKINYEYFITADSQVENYEEAVRHIGDDKILLSSKKDAEGIIALIQLTRLHDEWVGDWKLTKDNTFCSIIYNRRSDGFMIECCNYRLLMFPTCDMADEFFKCFNDLLEKAKKFL